MKIKFSKLLSLMLSVMMIMGTFCVPGLVTEAAEADAMYDGYVLADFSNFDYSVVTSSTDRSGVNFVIGGPTFSASPVAYGDGISSLRVQLDPDKPNSDIKLPAPGWQTWSAANPNAVVKVRYKGDEAGDQFNLVAYKVRNGKYIGLTGEYAPVTDTEWKIAGIPLKNIAAISGDSTPADENSFIFKFDFNGWTLGNANWVDGRGFYIDKIWVENPAKWSPSANGSDDMIKEAKYSTSVTYDGASYADPRDGGSNYYDMFHIEPTQKGKSNFTFTPSDKSQYSGKDYRYVNIWMYSPYPQQGGTTIAINWHKVTGFDENGKRVYAQVDAGKDGFAYNKTYAVRFDWKGWKLITIPFDAKSANSYEVDGPDGTKVTEYYYINNIKNATSWAQSMGLASVQTGVTSDFGTATSLVVDGANAASHQNNYFGVDGLWVSKKAPTAPASTVNKTETPALATIDGDVVISEHNSTATVANFKNMTIVGENGRLYNTTAKTKDFGGARVDTTNFKVSQGTAVEAGVIASSVFTTITTQKYFNVWMYSPGVRYDQYGNYSEYIISFTTVNADGGDSRNSNMGVLANWQGWKLLSIPFSAMSNMPAPSASAPRGIKIAKITCNGWLPSVSATKDGTYYHTEAELSSGMTKRGNYNVFAANKNYFLVDRMWFSNGPAATSFGAVTAPGSIEDNTLTWTFADKIGKIGVSGSEKAKVVAYDKINDTYSTFEAELAATDKTVSISSEFKYNHLYTVYLPEIFDTYGNTIPGKDRTLVIDSGTNSKFEYTIDANNNATITGYTNKLTADELKNLVIPEKIGDIYPVVEVKGFADCTTIQTLTLPSTLKTLGTNAFYKCTGLTTVTMPSCEKMKSQAFYGCNKLVYMNSDYSGEIVLPDNLTTLENDVFRTANSIKTVVLPESLTTVGAGGTLYRTSGVKNIYFPAAIPQSAYVPKMLGGYSGFKTVDAYGPSTSYIKTYAESEEAVDKYFNESYDTSSMNKLYNYIEDASDLMIYDISYVDGYGVELRGTNKDIGNASKAVGIKARVFNGGTSDEALRAIISVTSKDGLLKSVDLENITIPAREGITLDGELLRAENVELADGDVIKVLFWEDGNSVKPVVTRDIGYVVDTSVEEILVMAIGNSFAQDSMTYLKPIAAADGVNISSYNCYVGGRPLDVHYNAWVNEVADYEIQPEGARTNITTSSNDMVKMYDWDYILVQGTTHSSHYDKGLWGAYTVDSETIWTTLANGISAAAPNAKRFVHATWAPYETLSAAMNSGMFKEGTPDARGAYTKAVLERDQIGADIFSTEVDDNGDAAFVPTAVAIDYLIRHYGFAEHEGTLDSNNKYSNASNCKAVYRDTTCHLTDNVGRVLAGLVWYEMITGTPATENAYTRSTLTADEMTMIKEAAHYACVNYKTYDLALITPAA